MNPTPESAPLTSAVIPTGETPYDRVQYMAASFPQMAPSRIAAVGTLFGLKPPSPSRCRVLELGCGQGFTLLSLAQLYPDSEFLGIDLSVRHIENAKCMAEEAGLSNVRFEHRSIADITKERDGEYDYITSHGVYSWVSPDIQKKILAICGEHLTPQGMAYISYNTLPGWAHLRVIREMLIYHTQRYSDPLEKFNQAKILVSFLRETAPGGPDGWLAKWLVSVETLLAHSDPSYFLHEYLEETNDPCFFHQFMDRAADAGLQYVSESAIASTFSSNLGPHGKVVEMLKRSVIDGEQYMDFARNTKFRSTLLCHADITINRSIDYARLRSLLYATALRPVANGRNLDREVAEEFIFPNGSKFSSRDPLAKAALHFLSGHPGVFLSLPAMLEGARMILSESGVQLAPTPTADEVNILHTLVGRFIVAGVAEISTPDLGEFLPTTKMADPPFAPPLSRVQAAKRLPILRGSLRSEKASESASALLALCDGSRTHEELFAFYQKQVASGALPVPVPLVVGGAPDLKAAFQEILQEMTQGAMLWTPSPRGQ